MGCLTFRSSLHDYFQILLSQNYNRLFSSEHRSYDVWSRKEFVVVSILLNIWTPSIEKCNKLMTQICTVNRRPLIYCYLISKFDIPERKSVAATKFGRTSFIKHKPRLGVLIPLAATPLQHPTIYKFTFPTTFFQE